MNSIQVLESLQSSLEGYFASNYTGTVPNVVELYPLNLDFLDRRSDIPGIRIGISELGDEPGTLAEDTKVLDTSQQYEFQLFFKTGREGLDWPVAEKLMYEYKDLIYQWGYDLDPGTVTSEELLTFNWNGSDQPIREEMFTSMNITYLSFRNLC